MARGIEVGGLELRWGRENLHDRREWRDYILRLHQHCGLLQDLVAVRCCLVLRMRGRQRVNRHGNAGDPFSGSPLGLWLHLGDLLGMINSSVPFGTGIP